MGVFQEQAKDKLDWTDQDLLTYAEAQERLVEEEAALIAEIETVAGDAADLALTRLGAVRKILSRLRESQAAAIPPV